MTNWFKAQQMRTKQKIQKHIFKLVSLMSTSSFNKNLRKYHCTRIKHVTAIAIMYKFWLLCLLGSLLCIKKVNKEIYPTPSRTHWSQPCHFWMFHIKVLLKLGELTQIPLLFT